MPINVLLFKVQRLSHNSLSETLFLMFTPIPLLVYNFQMLFIVIGYALYFISVQPEPYTVLILNNLEYF